MTTNEKPLAHKAYVVVLWWLPLTYILLLQRVPQIYASAGLIVGLLLGLYGLGCGFLLWRIGWRQMATPFDWGFLAMTAALVISAVFSIDPSRSWRTVWSWTACFVALYLAVTFFRAGSSLQQFVQALLTVIFFMLLPAYAEFFGWVNRWLAAFGTELLPNVAQIPRVWGISGSPNILGFYVAIGLILALTYRTAEGQKWPWLARLWVVVALPVLFLARSRSAFLGLAAGLSIVVLGWFWIRLRGELSYKAAVRAGTAIALLGVVSLGAVFILRPDTSLSERNVSYRLQLWGFAFETWQSYPVTGSGADTFGTAVLLQDETAPPRLPLRAAHNWWFSILSETGLLGMGAALFCWGVLLRFLWRYQRYEHWSISIVGVLSCLVVFTGHALLDTPEHWVILTAALLFGVLIVSLEAEPINIKRGFLPIVWGAVWVCLLVGGYRGYTAASIYETGLAAAESGDWRTAAEQFDAAQERLPYTDSGFLLASAFAHAVMAQGNLTHLPIAIDLYEQLIVIEPGWPSNHANLASLYWLDGRETAAVEQIDQAIQLSPQTLTYHLNRGLWTNTADGDLTYEVISLGVDLPDFEEETGRSEATHWLALANGQVEEAADLFARQRSEQPTSGEAYLGSAIVAFLQNRPEEAQQYYKQAELLGMLDSFWRGLILDGVSLQEVLTLYQDSSTFGMTTASAEVYGRGILNRRTINYDLLPGLMCFTTDVLLQQNLQILLAFHDLQQAHDEVIQIETFLEGEWQGIRPCVTIDL